MSYNPEMPDGRAVAAAVILPAINLFLIALHAPGFALAVSFIAGVLALAYLAIDMRLINAGKETITSRITRRNDTDTTDRTKP